MMHHWWSLFAQLYIGFGLFSWFFPTHELPEIIARVVFITFGVAFIILRNNQRWSLYLLRTSIGLVILWIGLGSGLIVDQYSNPIYRVHFGYMPFWYLLIVLHFKAVQDGR